MASLFRDPRSSVFVVEFYDPARKPAKRRVSTAVRDQRPAERLRRFWEAEYAEGRYDPWADASPVPGPRGRVEVNMARCLHPKLGPSPKTAPARVKEVYSPKTLVAFEITGIDDPAAAVTVVKTELTYEEDGTEKRVPFEFRLVYVDPEGRPETRGLSGADWAIVFWAV